MCWTFTSAPLGKGWGLGVGGGDTELSVNHFIVLFTSRWFYFGQFSQLKVLLKLSKLLSPDGFPVPLPLGSIWAQRYRKLVTQGSLELRWSPLKDDWK